MKLKRSWENPPGGNGCSSSALEYEYLSYAFGPQVINSINDTNELESFPDLCFSARLPIRSKTTGNSIRIRAGRSRWKRDGHGEKEERKKLAFRAIQGMKEEEGGNEKTTTGFYEIYIGTLGWGLVTKENVRLVIDGAKNIHVGAPTLSCI